MSRFITLHLKYRNLLTKNNTVCRCDSGVMTIINTVAINRYDFYDESVLVIIS